MEVKVQKAQQSQVESTGGRERKVEVGDDVWYRQYMKGEKWLSGTIVNSCGPSDYAELDGNGRQVHRHIDQLRRRVRSSLVIPTEVSHPPELSPAPTASPSTPLQGRSERPEVSGAPRTPPPQCNASPSQVTTVDEHLEDTVGEFATPPSAPVPPQSRPLRKCRLNKKFNYKI